MLETAQDTVLMVVTVASDFNLFKSQQFFVVRLKMEIFFVTNRSMVFLQKVSGEG